MNDADLCIYRWILFIYKPERPKDNPIDLVVIVSVILNFKFDEFMRLFNCSYFHTMFFAALR